MMLRVVLLSLLAVYLVGLPVVASQPAGLAGKLITDLGDPGGFLPPVPPGTCGSHSLEWVEFIGSHQLDPADTLTLGMALLPFGSGRTFVGLDAFGGPTFFGLEFSNGLVQGLPYKRADWNDVTVRLRPATQDYTLTVNGLQAGPFPFATFCQDQGGCFTVQALRLHGFANELGSIAWIDSLSISRESAAGEELFHQVTFDTCSPRPLVSGGVILVTEPPDPLIPRGCPGRARH